MSDPRFHIGCRKPFHYQVWPAAIDVKSPTGDDVWVNRLGHHRRLAPQVTEVLPAAADPFGGRLHTVPLLLAVVVGLPDLRIRAAVDDVQ